MGLDAFVFCDCYEKGSLKRFDRWRENACEHEAGMVAGDWLGNASLIGSIRNELSRRSRDFPTLLKRVVYSGTHCGDHLTLKLVAKLQMELDRLKTLRSGNKELDRGIQRLRRQLQKLVHASLKIGKP